MSIKPIHKYSEEYYDLCRKAHNEGVTLSFATRRKAINFRIEMYQFRMALRKALRANPNSEELQLAALFAEGLEFQIDGTNLNIRNKEPIHVHTIRSILP